jgi:hypothetical protein
MSFSPSPENPKFKLAHYQTLLFSGLGIQPKFNEYVDLVD